MNTIRITAEDNGKEFEVQAGDEIEIRLAENPSTGFAWELETGEAEPYKLKASEYLPGEKSGFGSGGTRQVRLEASTAGDSQVRLRLRRAWETQQAGLELFQVGLHVR